MRTQLFLVKIFIAFSSLLLLLNLGSCGFVFSEEPNTEQNHSLQMRANHKLSSKNELPSSFVKTAAGTELTEIKAEPLHEKVLKQPLKVIITNLESSTAIVEISFYKTQSSFLQKGQQLKKYHVKPNKGLSVVSSFNDLPYGDLAIDLYQDVNGNGHIDQDFIGIPKEPYGFSNDIRPKVKSPDFEECKFSYNAKMNTITMSMIR